MAQDENPEEVRTQVRSWIEAHDVEGHTDPLSAKERELFEYLLRSVTDALPDDATVAQAAETYSLAPDTVTVGDTLAIARVLDEHLGEPPLTSS